MLTSGAPALAFTVIGVGTGIVYKRWGQAGTGGLIIGTMVLFGGLAILISWLDAWGSVGAWFADRSPVTLTIGLPAAIALIAAVVSFPGIRREIP